MRATSFRKLLGGVTALLLVGTTLSAPVLGAVPTAAVSSEAIPASWSPGFDAGFRGRYTYGDGSTLARLYLVIDVEGASANSYLSVTKNGASVSCAKAIPVSCSFKTVRLGDVFDVTAAFTPGVGSTVVTATFIWSTTGSTGSDGGTSHGDTWPTDPVALDSTVSNDPDFAGGFLSEAGAVVANGQTVSATNIQATRVVGVPAGIAATVKDGSGANGVCTSNATVDCGALIGEWSEVTVGDGQSFSVFQIVITLYAGTPKSFVHSYVDTNGDPQQETIFACTNRKNPAASAPCFVWSAKTNQATIYTLHNGSWRGQ